uniref:Uncharacterized protein n=1 Tax=Aegilops tauschii subsp. strangulata TaxID=200361 RepID=A0A453DLT4_AEGTS
KLPWLLATSNDIALEKQFILFDLLGACCRVKGVRFFECPQGHGAIVRPEKVKVGNFPERDPFDDEDEI